MNETVERQIENRLHQILGPQTSDLERPRFHILTTDRAVPAAPLQEPAERKLIGIAGKARSGKDSAARQLTVNWGFQRIAFADAVKRTAQAMFFLTPSQTWDESLKEIEIPYWGMSPRRMFQLVGTEAGRNVFGTDLWVRRWLASTSAPGRYVAPDVRFENEAQAIRDQGGIMIHVVRPDNDIALQGETAGHASEAGVAIGVDDWVIVNNRTLDDLWYRVDLVAKAYLEGGAW